MKVFYLSALALTFGISVRAADSTAHPANLLPGLKLVECTVGDIGNLHDRQSMLALEAAGETDGYQTLGVWGCSLSTGQPGNQIEILRTEGSKVYLYMDEATEEDEKWALLYDFNPQIGEIFTFIGFPLEWRDSYDARCVEVIESDPAYGGLTTLVMDIRRHGASFDDESVGRPEKWIVGIGSQCGLLNAGLSGWDGGGSWIMEAYNGDNSYFTDPDVRRYEDYIGYGTTFMQQGDGSQASILLENPDYPENLLMWPRCDVVYAILPVVPMIKQLLGGIYTKGNKVFYANIPETAIDTDWHTIYDFAIEPGETAMVSRVEFDLFSTTEVLPSFRDVWAECVSVEPYEHDPKFTVMHMMIYADKKKQNLIGPAAWIKGIGSLSGLLDNCPSTDYPSEPLSEVTYGNEVIFRNPTAGVPTVAAPASREEIYDLSGRRVYGDPNSLSGGLYIKRDATGTHKVMIP